MTAAVDATLLGARVTDPESLLRSAVPAPARPSRTGKAPGDWFEAALASATQPCSALTAALVPVSVSAVMGGPMATEVAGYLVRRTGRVEARCHAPRRSGRRAPGIWRIPPTFPGSVTPPLRVPGYTAAVPLLRKAVDAGSASAMHDLGELYRRMRDEEAAQEMADRLSASDDPQADLYQVLPGRQDFEEIADLAEAGNEYFRPHRRVRRPALGHAGAARPDGARRPRAWRRMAELLRDEGEEERAADILDMIFRQDDEPDDDPADVLRRKRQAHRP